MPEYDIHITLTRDNKDNTARRTGQDKVVLPAQSHKSLAAAAKAASAHEILTGEWDTADILLRRK